jgi:polysaccharide export outer membrane protein
MKFLSLLCFLVILVWTSSCVSRRAIANNYLIDAKDTSGKDWAAKVSSTIKKNDLLSIAVYSKALGSRPEVDLPYNLPNDAGYLVDQNGNIEYPQLGVIHVEGLTREGLAELIRSKLDTVLTQPSVVIRFLNYRITILGEVRGPSTFTVPTEHITIMEALGLAGDITEFGKKEDVKVIRESNGQREIGSIDLTSKDMFSSPYYNLQQNDVILVSQTKRKITQQQEQQTMQQITYATSIITAVVLIITFIFPRK